MNGFPDFFCINLEISLPKKRLLCQEVYGITYFINKAAHEHKNVEQKRENDRNYGLCIKEN